MSSCQSCDLLINNNDYLQCTACSGLYHLSCLDLTLEQALNVRQAWLCSFCSSVNTRRRRNDNTPVQRAAFDDSVMSLDDSHAADRPPLVVRTDNSNLLVTPPNSYHEIRNISGNSSSLLTSGPEAVLHDILTKVSALQTQFSAIQAIQSDLSQVKNDIAEMRSSIDSKLTDLAGRMSTIESRVTALEECKAELDDVKKAIGDVINDSRRNEQWVRRSNIQINGVPETKGENLFTILKSLADLSGYSLNTNTDVDFVTRVAVRNDSDGAIPKPIIVKMQARYKKDDFMASLRKLRNLKASDLGYSTSLNRIYVNDHLSTYNKYLLKEAKQRAKQKKYQFCWVRNCTVMVRRDEKSPVLYIGSEEALNKIS
ncbi:uncharacterized protein LOC134801547 [Cydia splendana]|uniref:uncharacterized protein LOC134801547 n=1 Tax=Cydia splendana TaxID=1100963 RepID=UPI00214304A4